MGMTASIGAQVAGAGISAYGSYKEGELEQQAYERNAKGLQEAADSARLKGKLNEFQKLRVMRQQIGEQRAVYAKAGVNINTGSPLDVMVNDMSNAYLDIAIDNYNNELAARELESRAANERTAGSAAKSAGTMKAGLTLLQTAGSLGKYTIGAGKQGTKVASYYPGVQLKGAKQPGFAMT
jgi:hypothetical protein